MSDTQDRLCLTVEEAQAVLDRIQYLHNGGQEATFAIRHDPPVGTRLSMTVGAYDSRDERLWDDPSMVPDDVFPTSIVTSQFVSGREMRDAETLVRFALGMAVQFAAHEAAEWFRVDGEMIYDPHDPNHGEVVTSLPRYPLPRGLLT